MTFDARVEGSALARKVICDCAIDGDPSKLGGHQQWCRASERWERYAETCTSALEHAFAAGLAAGLEKAEGIVGTVDPDHGWVIVSAIRADRAARAAVAGKEKL